MKKFVLEGLGTAILIFIGCGCASIVGPYIGAFGIAIGFGFAYILSYYILRNFSPCHFNPVFSLASYLTGNLEKKEFWFLVLFQCIGAFVASMILSLLFLFSLDFSGLVASTYFINAFGESSPKNISFLSVIITELLFTTMFVFIFLKVFYSKEKSIYAGIIVGLVYMLLTLITVNVSGACLNPARVLGPNLVAVIMFSSYGLLLQILVYVIVTCVASFIAVWVYKRFTLKEIKKTKVRAKKK